MKRKIFRLLFVFCMMSTVSVMTGCGEAVPEAAPETAVSMASTAPSAVERPEDIIFNGESISLNEYVSLMALYQQMSFDNVVIESNSDFLEEAGQYGGEELYDLHEFIDSLTASEAGELHRIALQALNNM